MNASPLCSLATVSPGGHAHINHMYFAWSDRFEVFWISDPDSIHSRNLMRNPSAAVTLVGGLRNHLCDAYSALQTLLQRAGRGNLLAT